MSTSKVQEADSRWGWLYKIGGAAALFSVVIIPIQVIIFIVWGQSNIFGGATAYTGIVAAILNWGLYAPGGLGLILGTLSVVPFLAIWLILVARKLFQPGRDG